MAFPPCDRDVSVAVASVRSMGIRTGCFFRTVVGAATVAGIVSAPPAGASPVCVGVLNQSGCQPAPWNGQLMETWNTPGYYGGWTNGPVMCDPFTRQCRGWAQP